MAAYNFIINGTHGVGFTASCIAHGEKCWTVSSTKLIIVMEEMNAHVNMHCNRLHLNLEPLPG